MNFILLSDWMENISLIVSYLFFILFKKRYSLIHFYITKYQAHEVQKDFIIANRLIGSKEDKFCQLQHDLRHRTESSKINYTINLPHSNEDKVCYQNGNFTTCYTNVPKVEKPITETTTCYKYSDGKVICKGDGSSNFYNFTSIFDSSNEPHYNRSEESSSHSSKRDSFMCTESNKGILKNPTRDRTRSRSTSQVRFNDTNIICDPCQPQTRAF